MPISEVKNMDCVEGMKQYPDKFFELAIVDPPYGLDIANMNMGAGKGNKCSKIENRLWKPKDWDKGVPDSEYFNELFRVSQNQIIWGGNYFPLRPTQGFVIWDKQIDEQLSFSQCEFAWCSFQRAAKIYRRSVYKTEDDKIHPTQKPVALYKWLLLNYAKEGDKILDTHLGSGSSRIAAYIMGFNFYSFEIDKEYYEGQEKRFRQQTAQQDMFGYGQTG